MNGVKQSRTRIAVLGGGISALSAVFDLTARSGWQEKYDITVYQMGWRLGGKGASSRNRQYHNRIEEHGLHIWLGFYENAFEIMRTCYGELAGTPGVFPTWRDAFKPHSFIVLEEKIDTGWLHWPTTFPANDSLPGDGEELPTLPDYLEMALEWLSETFTARQQLIHSDVPVDLSSLSSSIVAEESTPDEKQQQGKATRLIHAAHRRAYKLNARRKHSEMQKQLTPLVDDFSKWFGTVFEKDLAGNTELRRLFIPVDLFCAVTRGMLAENAVVVGFDAIDDYEFRSWLARHGASALSLSSAWIRGLYDLAFSFENGDSAKPNLAAGVAVRAIFRLVFTYKGGILWKMQAGMGETIFTPLYLVLRRRGVQFKFFHKVDKFELNTAKDEVEHIHFSVQAHIKGQHYEPLERIREWDCWRAEPDYDQLVDGDQLQSQKINLESNWSDWRAVQNLVLDAGKDFDAIILGIPIAALTNICEDLAKVRADWRRMLFGVKTTQTQGFQLWLNKSLAECGWEMESPILGAYVEPLDTWADMTHLLAAEGWPTTKRPKQLAYFCGVMSDAAIIPPPSDTSFPASEKKRAREAARDYLTANACYLWPRTVQAQGPEFDWNVLVADENTPGEARFESQYWRPNIDPSERYTLAVAGSTKFRLRADQSGFRNLFLAGDWVRNGFNTPGCIESAVISGRQAARALGKTGVRIIGESDFPPETGLVLRALRWLLGLLGSFFGALHKR
jgi:uncharacterized protein with NAD-binding domain and iron-sulfur cluster